MAVFFLNDCEVFAGSSELTGVTNAVTLNVDADDLDTTTFSSGGARSRIQGLKNVDLSVSGYFDVASTSVVDPAIFNGLGVNDTPFTIAANAAEGSTAYGFLANWSRLSMFGDLGTVAPFDASAMGRGGMARGFLVANRTSTATSTTSAVTLGTIATGHKLAVGLHVFAVSGTGTPTLTVVMQSDDGAGFGSPTTRHSFTAATAVGSQFATVAGPITPDDRYRCSFTISGTNPSFTWAAFVGTYQ